MTMEKTRKLWLLFSEMFKIALFVVGGGFAIIAVADEVFSKKLKWTEEGEIAGSLPLFQMVPGIIAGNTAVYVGRKVAGVPGALAAAVGVFLPSVLVFSAVSAGYAAIPVENRFLSASFLGLRAALAGIIAAMVVKSWKKCIDGLFPLALMAGALAAIALLGANPALVVAVSIALGVAAKTAPGAVRRPGGGMRLCSVLWAIPAIFLKYGAIAFGGGYVLVPVYINDFVGPGAAYLQLGATEFADVMALTQMTPGPISVNCATFFGYRMGIEAFGGVAGGVACAFLATLCLLLPGAILLYAALGSIERFSSSRIVQGIMSGAKPVTIAMMLNAAWAFASMSVWTRGPGGPASVHPVALAVALAVAWATCGKRAGVVKCIFLGALATLDAEVIRFIFRS